MPDAKLTDDASDQCLHELIEAAAQARPGLPAVVAGEFRLTYSDLDQRASSLADCLTTRGVGPESIVGVHLPKTPEAIVAMLAVLKAGAAFTPLDPARPGGQLARLPLDAIISDSAVPPATLGRDLLVLASSAAGPARGQPAQDRPAGRGARAGTRNLAYVIYTSGSTGAPKGVAVEHSSIVRSTLARLRLYEPARSFLLLSPIAFDSAFAGLFGTLASGGAVVLPGQGRESDTREMARVIARNHIDALLALPSLFGLILESASPGELDSLRTVIVAGERCPAGLLPACSAAVPQVTLVNEYGPTECTVWSTAWRASAGEVTEVASVPIGSPVEGTRIHLLDPAGRVVPDGELGEICIAGPGVARGYLGRPDLTAASFVPEPSGPPGSRMYRSGDQGWRRPDGLLEFAGRLDRQLKISGFRVEPGEVEQALLALPSVREAAVLASRPAPASTLTAFISGAADPAEVRAQLRTRLPGYLVPAEVRSLTLLPRTVNGKLDYGVLAKLLAGDGDTGTGGTGGSAPVDDQARSPVEQVVTRIWAEALGRAGPGRSDRFTDLGGSIEAVVIALQLSAIFSTEVPISWVYEASTIDQLAQWLEVNSSDATGLAEKNIEKRAGEDNAT